VLLGLCALLLCVSLGCALAVMPMMLAEVEETYPDRVLSIFVKNDV